MKIPLVFLLDEWNLPVPFDDEEEITYGDFTTAEGLKSVRCYKFGCITLKSAFPGHACMTCCRVGRYGGTVTMEIKE